MIGLELSGLETLQVPIKLIPKPDNLIGHKMILIYGQYSQYKF